MNVAEFIAEVQKIYSTGQATEHSYRSALGQLFDSIAPDVSSLNEPTQGKSGRPDLVLLRNSAERHPNHRWALRGQGRRCRYFSKGHEGRQQGAVRTLPRGLAEFRLYERA